MAITLPANLRKDIQQHIQNVCDDPEDIWESANDEEDTITGALFQKLKTRKKSPRRYLGWSWKINYKKIRGRGPNAPENLLGLTG